MEWTRPLGVVATLVVVALAVAGTFEVGRSTLAAGDTVVAAGTVIGFLVVVVLGTVAVGAKSNRWIENPDAYW